MQSSVVLCISSSWGSWMGSTTRGMLSGGYHSNIRSSVVCETVKIVKITKIFRGGSRNLKVASVEMKQ